MQLFKVYSTIIYYSLITVSTAFLFNNIQAAQDFKIFEANATQKDYQDIKTRNYSETHKIYVKRLSYSRDSQQKVYQIQIHILDKDNRYLDHGFLNDKFRPEKLSKGIPLDQHPIVFVKYQPEKVEIKRYELKRRSCGTLFYGSVRVPKDRKGTVSVLAYFPGSPLNPKFGEEVLHSSDF